MDASLVFCSSKAQEKHFFGDFKGVKKNGRFMVLKGVLPSLAQVG
jgi:hypothetical protein